MFFETVIHKTPNENNLLGCRFCFVTNDRISDSFCFFKVSQRIKILEVLFPFCTTIIIATGIKSGVGGIRLILELVPKDKDQNIDNGQEQEDCDKFLSVHFTIVMQKERNRPIK